jgi:flagellin
MIQVADGALSEMTGILQRMREITVQASSATYTATDIGMIAKEFNQLRDEISNIVSYTEWNGTALLDGNVNSAGGSNLGVDTLTITAANLTGLGDDNDATFTITDSEGKTLTIDQTAIGATTGTPADFSAATLEQLKEALNTAIDADSGFAQMDVDVSGDSLTFTQEVANSGQISSVAGRTDATTSVAVGSGVSRTTNSGSDTVSFQIGTNVNQVLSVDFGTMAMTGATGNDLGANFTNALTISTNADANTAMGYVDSAIDAVNTRRATLGAAIGRLEHTVDNLENNAVNHAASRSQILDADYAAETTELARTQIIQQAGTAMLAQANQKSQSVLQLLKG